MIAFVLPWAAAMVVIVLVLRQAKLADEAAQAAARPDAVPAVDVVGQPFPDIRYYQRDENDENDAVPEGLGTQIFRRAHSPITPWANLSPEEQNIWRSAVERCSNA